MVRRTLGALVLAASLGARWRSHCWSTAVRRFRRGIPVTGSSPGTVEHGTPSTFESQFLRPGVALAPPSGTWTVANDRPDLFQLNDDVADSRLGLLKASAVEGEAVLAHIDELAADHVASIVRRHIPIALGPHIGWAVDIETSSEPFLLYAGDGAEWTAGTHAYLRIGVVPAEGDDVFVVVIQVGQDAPAGTLEIADSALQHASVRDGRPLLCCALVR